jgi:Tfp pilus assembly protein PilF
VLAVLVYLNALDNPFVYDDRDTVVANPSLVDLSNIRFILTHSPYRPVVNASYALDRAVWGTDPFGFHLTNIVLHAFVVVLLYAILRAALADARGLMSSGPSRGLPSDAWVAFGGASLFGVHPLMSEAVGYVSGRSELLCGFFFLATLLCARAAILQSRALWWIPAGALAVLALLSKEVALVLPVVLLAYDWLVLPGALEARRRRAWLLFLPCAVAASAAAVYRISVAAGPVSMEAPLLSLWTQSIVIWRYLALLFVPVGQSIMHGVYVVSTPGDPQALVAVSGLVVLLLLALLVRRKMPLVSFGIVWFLAVIAPSSSVVALREGMAEHRAYLASAGVFMAIAGAAASRRAAPARRPGLAYTATFAVVCLALGLLTLARNDVWESPVKLWGEATVHAADMWEPHYALADVLRESGDCTGAVVEYRTVVQMRPHHRDAHTNLGICLAQTNQLAEAETAFQRALEIDPAFARGYTNLGALALTVGQPERARGYYRRAIEVDPRNVLARMQLARLYETVFGDFHAAVRMCGEARALAPATPGVVDCVERNQRRAAARDAGQ